MTIIHHAQFRRAYKKRIQQHPSLATQFQERIRLFQENPHHPLLRDHALKGSKVGFCAFSITGDIRIVYRRDENTIIFYDIGTHNQVY